jgi:hypothetical protein
MITFERVQEALRAPAHFTPELQPHRALVYFCVLMMALRRIKEKYPSLVPLIEMWVKMYSKHNVLQLFSLQLTPQEQRVQKRALNSFNPQVPPCIDSDMNKLNAIMQFVAEYKQRHPEM